MATKGHETHINSTVEIREIPETLFELVDKDEIIEHKFPIQEGRKKTYGTTYRIAVTKDGTPSVMGWKLIKLALMGKSWRYISKLTGIDHNNIRGIFKHNDVIREAVLHAEEQLVEQAKADLFRSLRRATKNFVNIATGNSSDSAHKQKVQLEAIKELYNRIGFLVPERGSSGGGDDYVIRLEGGDSRALAVLMERRSRKQIAGGANGASQEEAGQEGERAVGLGSESSDGVIDGEYTER